MKKQIKHTTKQERGVWGLSSFYYLFAEFISIVKSIKLTRLKLGSVFFALIPSRVGVWLVLVLVTAFSLTPLGLVESAAGINEQINFQARLLNADGSLASDGNYHVRFKIYQDGDGDLGGGDETLKWTETHTTGNLVNVTNGYLSVQLNSINADFSAIDWHQTILWLSLDIGGTGGSPSWDGEMDPFMRLTAVPYALNAGELEGISSSGFVQLGQGEQAYNSATTAIAIDQAGAGDLVDLQVSNSQVFGITNAGNLTAAGTANIQGASLTIGSTTQAGSLIINEATNDNTVGIDTGTQSIGSYDVSFPELTQDDVFCLASKANCLGAAGQDLQGAYDAGNTIATSNNRNILFTLADTATDSDFIVDIVGTENVFEVLDNSVAVFQVADGGSAYFQTEVDSTTGFQVLDTDGGTPILTVDTVNERVIVGGSDTAASLFVLDTKTDTGDPSGINGAMYYNSNSGKFRCYESDAWSDCGSGGGGLFTDDGSFTYLTSTTDDLVLGSSTVAAASLYFDEDAGNLYLGTNETLNGTLTFYSSGAGETDPTIAADASGDLNIQAPSGTVVVGSGSGHIQFQLDNEADLLLGQKSASLTAAYSANDFTFTRSLANSVSTESMGGAVLKVTDTSSAVASTTINYDLILGNAAPTGSSFTGNLLRLQSSGSDKFVVDEKGFLGIGITDPGAEIHVQDSAGTASLRLEGDTNIWDIRSATSNGQFRLWDTTGGSGVVIISPGVGEQLRIQSGAIAIGGADATPDASLEIIGDSLMVSSAAANDGDVFIVNSSGNVGINDNTPLRRLDVAGSSRIQGETVTLTGSIDPDGTTTVTGVGTAFTTEVFLGDQITVSGETRKVVAIATDTSLTVDIAFSDTANDTSPDVIQTPLQVVSGWGTGINIVDQAGNNGGLAVEIYDTNSGTGDEGMIRLWDTGTLNVQFSADITNDKSYTLGEFGVGTATPTGELGIYAGSTDNLNLLSFQEGASADTFFFEANFAGTGGTGNWLTLKDWTDQVAMAWRGDRKVAIGSETFHGTLNLMNVGASDGVKALVIAEDTAEEFGFYGNFAGSGETGNSLYIGSGVGGGWSPNIMTWRGDGNVGIGATNPGYQLEVQDTGDTRIEIESTDATNSAVLQLTSNSISNFVFTGGSGDNPGDLVIRSASNQDILLDPQGTGEVGIGTPDPYAQLMVTKTTSGQLSTFNPDGLTGLIVGDAIAARSDATVQDIFSVHQPNTQSASKGSTFGVGLSFWEDPGNNFPRTLVHLRTTGRTTDDSSAGNTVMVLRDDGNVGIGDTTPAQRLVVQGATVSTSGIYGAETGAPDSNIWAVSGDFTNWGMYYNEGSPDYIEFRSGGTARNRIGLDSSIIGILESSGGAYWGNLDVGDLNANRTYTFPDESGTVCTTGSVCTGYQAAGSYDNYVSWTLQDGDTTQYTVTSSDVLQITGGAGITSNFSGDDVLDISVTADSIGDTELAYNTGQHLTSSSSPQFAGLTTTGDITIDKATATIYLGSGADAGPHGLVFADTDSVPDIQLVYRTTPDQLLVEDASDDSDLAYWSNTGDYWVNGDITINGANLILGSTNLSEAEIGPLADNGAIEYDEITATGLADEYCLTYEATGTTFAWQDCAAAGLTEGEVEDYIFDGDNGAKNLTSGTIDSITLTNLVDKSATESIAGSWTYTSAVILDGQTDNADGYDRSTYWAYDANVGLVMEPAADDGATAILFPSIGNNPSDFAYIVYDEDYGEAGVAAGENGVLLLGSENDGTGSSDHVRVKSRLVVEADTASSDPTNAFQVKASNTTTDLLRVARAGDVTIGVGNLTVTGDVDIDGNDLTSAGDLTITPAGGDTTITGFVWPTNGIEMYRQNGAQHGISWYNSAFTTWIEYMGQAAQTSLGPHANLTAPSGSLVTSWALRSYIENVAGYGWTWESDPQTDTTPTVRFEIRSSDGSFRSAGDGYIAGGDLTLGSTALSEADLDALDNGTITLGTETSGNYTESVSGGTAITVTGGTGIGNTPSIAVTADSIGDTQLAYNTGQHLTTSSSPTFSNVFWGSSAQRVETWDDLSSRNESGWYETSTASTAENWPENASWYHLNNTQHSNTGNYYAMQLAGDFFQQQWFLRNTNASGSTAWSEVVTSTNYSSFGDITEVVAGTGLANGGTSGSVTLNVGGGTCITANANDVAVTADCIGNTQLAYNTGQHLTTGSSPTFNDLTIDDDLQVAGIYHDESFDYDDFVYFAPQAYFEAESNAAPPNWTWNIDGFEKENNTSSPFSQVAKSSSYDQLYSGYIPVQAGETLYGEIWMMRDTGATGTAGTVYYGIERYDKDKNPIASNNGTSYFVASNYTTPIDSTWYKKSSTHTLPTSHTPYLGSDGGPVRYVRVRILMNYSAGTIPTHWGGVMLRRQSLARDTGDLTTNGEFGVRTTPDEDLHVLAVAGSAATIKIQEATASAFTNLNQSDNNGDFTISRSGTGGVDISLQSDGDLILAQQGNVGIGTSSPNQELEVVGEIRTESSGADGYAWEISTTGTNDTWGSSELVLRPISQDASYPASIVVIDTPGTTGNEAAGIRLTVQNDTRASITSNGQTGTLYIDNVYGTDTRFRYGASYTGHFEIDVTANGSHFDFGGGSGTIGANVSGDDTGYGIYGSNVYMDSSGNLRAVTTNGSGIGYSGAKHGWGQINFYAESGNTTAEALVTPTPVMTIHSSETVGVGGVGNIFGSTPDFPLHAVTSSKATNNSTMYPVLALDNPYNSGVSWGKGAAFYIGQGDEYPDPRVELRLTDDNTDDLNVHATETVMRWKYDNSTDTGQVDIIGDTYVNGIFSVSGGGFDVTSSTIPLFVRSSPGSAVKVPLALRVQNSTGVGADGIGSRLDFIIETETEGNYDTAGQISAVATDATNDTVDSRMDFKTCYNGSCGVTMRLQYDGSLTIDGDLLSDVHNSEHLGSSSVTWNTVYRQSESTGSDRKLKKNVNYSSLGLDFIEKLQPAAWNWNGQLFEDDGKQWQGLVAQDVQDALLRVGVNPRDWAGIRYEDEYLALNYEQFIGPIIQSIQDQQDRIDIIESNINRIDRKLLNPTHTYLTVVQSANIKNLTVTNNTNIQKNLIVEGKTTVQDLYVNGKIVSSGDAVEAEKGSVLGDNDTAEAKGNSIAGSLTIKTTDPTLIEGIEDIIIEPIAAGEIIKIVFAEPYEKAPTVTLTPTNENSATLDYYVSKSKTGFTITVLDGLDPYTTYKFDYQVIQ